VSCLGWRKEMPLRCAVTLIRMRRQTAVCSTIGLLLVLLTGLLARGAWRHSITRDETAHLPSGVSHGRLGKFDLYCVNRLLIRMLGGLESDARSVGHGRKRFAGTWLGQTPVPVPYNYLPLRLHPPL